MMPGRTLHRLAARLCSAKTLERIVEPAIADLQKEYADARHALLVETRAGFFYPVMPEVLGGNRHDCSRDVFNCR